MENNSKKYLFNTLKNKVFFSALSTEKKKLWANLLLNSNINQWKIIADAMEEDEKNLQVLTQNLDDKSKAVQSKNNPGWDEIIKNEEEALRNM